MLGSDEKKFIELRDGFVAELNELNEQIEELMGRRNVLAALLDGRLENNEPNKQADAVLVREQIDDALVSFIAVEAPVKRPEIEVFFEGWNLSRADITRALERCKRRGLIQVKGKSKAAVWTAVK